MTFRPRLGKLSIASALPLALSVLSIVPAHAQEAAINQNLLAHAQSVSPEDTQTVTEATVWLNLHNKPEFDAAVANLYKPGSPTYRQWLTEAQLSKYLPTAQELETVKKEVSGKGLTVVSTDRRNLYVRVSGSVGAMQSAFNTTLNRYQLKEKSITAATTEPRLTGVAAPLVAHVGGFGGSLLRTYNQRAIDPETRQPLPPVPLSVSRNGIIFSSQCFFPAQSEVFKMPGKNLPVGTYYGNLYGAPLSNSKPGTVSPCGYSAADLSTAYGLNNAYSKNLKGQGQTIVIVDPNSSPTILADANTYSQLNGLPQLNASNFHIYQPDGPALYDSNSAGEITLDVELAHAAAPAAKIVLVEAQGFPDIQSAVAFAITSHFGNVISNSYGGPEALDSASDLYIWNALTQLGAATGISVNFSSGDSGDFNTGSKAIGVRSVSFPADAPYATSVGGTSLAINNNKSYKFETGWGNNQTVVYFGGVLDPPLNVGFLFGAGGGESTFFAKPSFERSLPGKGRQQPDVSAVADPYTGAEIIITTTGNPGDPQSIETIGGTSLACPFFSGVWAIANQNAGHALGQAAPIIASLPSNALHDVKPYSTPTNPSGVVIDANGPTYYSPRQLVDPVESPNPFLTALWNASNGWAVLSFGTDSSLTTATGWDNVTGYGSPNGLAFIEAAKR